MGGRAIEVFEKFCPFQQKRDRKSGMIQKANAATRSFAATLLGTACCVAAPGAAPAVRADDGGPQIEVNLCRVYPKRKADLEQWLRRELVPGSTTRQEVFAIFGRNYFHSFLDEDANTIAYYLDDLGVREHVEFDGVILDFDKRSGLLLRAHVGEVEHQTGFHITEATIR
jgi:hypothetical protein